VVQTTTEGGANGDIEVVNQLHSNSPVNSPMNSPVREKIPREDFETESPSPRNPNGPFSMFREWLPGERFADSLSMANLPDYPWQDDLPEFILYRLGQTESMSQGSWEHKFIQTLKRNDVHRARSGNEPTRLPLNWQPDRLIVAALRNSGIAQQFIDDTLLAFTAFWNDDDSCARSWNAKFIEHVQWKWVQRRPTEKTFLEKHFDRSWAIGLDFGPNPEITS
jgi:hypothetical protein